MNIKRLSLIAAIALSTSTLYANEATTPASTTTQQAKTTVVTDENYGLAETQVIFADYVKKIAAALPDVTPGDRPDYYPSFHQSVWRRQADAIDPAQESGRQPRGRRRGIYDFPSQAETG